MLGPILGTIPKPAKSFVIYPLADKAMTKAAFDEKELPVKFCRGHRYVGGFVGSTVMEDCWIEPMEKNGCWELKLCQVWQ